MYDTIIQFFLGIVYFIPVPSQSLISIISSFETLGAVDLFRPHIAIAYGYAYSFADSRADLFSMKDLFAPNFGNSLTSYILDKLQLKLPDDFVRFSGNDTQSNLPMDPATFEVFRVENYIPEVQYALDLSPSVEQAAPNFMASDIYDALVPSGPLTVEGLAKYAKKKILPKIVNATGGLFPIPLGDSSTEGGDDEGSDTESDEEGDDECDTLLFPPTFNIDDAEGFNYQLSVGFEGDMLVLETRFKVAIRGAEPLNALADVATSFNDSFQEGVSYFSGVLGLLFDT